MSDPQSDERIITGIAALRERLDPARAAGRRVGLVPTMGSLHDGHGSLIRRAAAENDLVVTTVFVNPLQFVPTDDLAAYPRDLDADVVLAVSYGTTVVFAPSVAEMYPFGPDRVLTGVRVAEVSAPLEGERRPGHFEGVATVVAKLFAIAGPCRAYFGEKDYQQLAVIRRMALDLSFPVEIVGCSTVREADGLAMSSRNRYLTNDERAGASVLYRALQAGVGLLEAQTGSGSQSGSGSGSPSSADVRAAMHALLDASPIVASVDYAEVVDAATLQPVDPPVGKLRLLVAARVGRARLIDNIGAPLRN